jgi:rubrerythrin
MVMQQAKYFKDQICDELKGAVCYLKKAIDWFKTRPEWAKHFYDMAEAEVGHATELYKMFMELHSENQDKDPYMSQMRDVIMECFSTEMRKIEDYKSTYSMIAYNGTATQSTPQPTVQPTVQRGSII